ncbi:hypothetical protein [Nguyenibacter vanlangensis]|uniref:Uncharacterized protein n=1 Tax=Nguyenibacter vanlangensis TaxID=1216886 RepID=A0A7Y7M694_9PROT|nr:hypothetical protein [Nguyenibacter vanlangensis]NVN10674.1 hypothetical protein [Nguyenibacter vanlangensis]
MSGKFSEALEYINGGNAYSIWRDLNLEATKNIETECAKKNLIEFFEFAISKNVIIEYDAVENVPIFSGDPPKIVAERIFGDIRLKNPNLPAMNPINNDDFLAYLMFKRGWAVLIRGTRLMFPE